MILPTFVYVQSPFQPPHICHQDLVTINELPNCSNRVSNAVVGRYIPPTQKVERSLRLKCCFLFLFCFYFRTAERINEPSKCKFLSRPISYSGKIKMIQKNSSLGCPLTHESIFSWARLQCDQLARLFLQYLAIYKNDNLLIWRKVCQSKFEIEPNTK